MKAAVWMIAVLALTAGSAMAQDVNEPTQATPDRPAASSLDKTLLANERKFGDALLKADRTAFLALVAPGAWMADATGFTKLADVAGMLDQLKLTSWSMTDEKVSWVDPTTAILTYKCVASGTFQGQSFTGPAYASSVWTKKGDRWLMAYHQGTQAAK